MQHFPSAKLFEREIKQIIFIYSLFVCVEA